MIITHNRYCVAAAVICAVENIRDEEAMTDDRFELEMQNGTLLDIAVGYISDGLTACRCDRSV